jgi:large subunit ribosomal protein L23
MHAFQVLKRPVITEKSTLLQEQNKYVFDVALNANKVQVKDAVERAFNVTVKHVNIMSGNAETKRLRNGAWKTMTTSRKAIVTLAPGSTIQLFEGA